MTSQAIATRTERLEFLSVAMWDDAQDIRARLKACELLGRAQGDFLERAGDDNEAAKPPSVVRIVIEDAAMS